MEHPDISMIERTGYPDRMQDMDSDDWDEDAAYEEARESELFGQW